MGEESKSLMDDLAEAWDAAEAELPEEQHDDELDQQSEPAEIQAADESAGPEDSSSGTEDVDLVQGGEAAAATAKDEDNAPPVGLSPAAREVWSEVPEPVQAEIRKREEDYERGIMKYSQNAKRAEMMDQMLGPYQQLFSINGGPGKTLPGLLQVASQLQMGTPQQKADTVANLIKQFGVDIGTLDSLLVGEAPPQEVLQQQTIEQQVQQGIARWQQAQAAQAQQHTTQQVNTELQQFASDPKNEFYADVRSDMADLLDMAARRNQPMTLEQAYERAVQIHPQISQIIAARGQKANTSMKRQAASSISGAPGGQGGGADVSSTRAALEEAWANAGRA